MQVSTTFSAASSLSTLTSAAFLMSSTSVLTSLIMSAWQVPHHPQAPVNGVPVCSMDRWSSSEMLPMPATSTNDAYDGWSNEHLSRARWRSMCCASFRFALPSAVTGSIFTRSLSKGFGVLPVGIRSTLPLVEITQGTSATFIRYS